ncbi:unnamed protein product [Mesocestoides corti]|uniref:Integrase catalytic domain-containing protein n=1 Tax=Mesocestoides corti TaxID=53468 RepID=A0A0R3UCE7_MESCO|nr:unnamed protein product [Mesocestoides corti]
MAGSSQEARVLWSAWNKLCFRDGVLYYKFGPSYPLRVVVPRSAVEQIVTELHVSLGHLGPAKVEQAARRRYWCPAMRDDINDICACCHRCGEVKSPPHAARAPLQPMTAGFPNELVASGNRYILVMVDYFTKWANAVPIRKADALSVAKGFMAGWVADHGVPYQIHTDRGSQFESMLLLELCDLLGVHRSRTTAYHPQGNGQVERTNRTLKMLIRLQLDEYGLNQWDDALPACLLAYRSAVHSSTGLTPAVMTFGPELRLPSDIVAPPPREQEYVSTSEYVAEVRRQLRRSFDSARSQLALAHKRQKDYYDKRAHGTPVEEGDLVWMATTNVVGEGRKFQRSWEGPYVVDTVLSETTCLIRSLDDSPGQGFTIHFNKLKPYVSSMAETDDERLRYCEPPPVDHTVEIAAVVVDERLGTASVLGGAA